MIGALQDCIISRMVSPSQLRSFKHLLLLLAICYLLLSHQRGASIPCAAQGACTPDYRRTGIQPFPQNIVNTFEQVGTNRLGATCPVLPPMFEGHPEPRQIDPYVPCILLKAIGAVESAQTVGSATFNGWKQFNADYGQQGTTVVRQDPGRCGYGIMQVTDGMNDGRPFPIGTIEPDRVASEPTYNICAAAIILINKWNTIANAIGSNNPKVVEHWYFSVGAYNSFSAINDPNDATRFPPTRNEWVCGRSASQNADNYPYQEKVYGCANNPPAFPAGTRLWQPASLALPVRQTVGFPPPAHLVWTLPQHGSCSILYLPILGRQ